MDVGSLGLMVTRHRPRLFVPRDIMYVLQLYNGKKAVGNDVCKSTF